MAQPIYEFDAAKFKRYANPPKFEGSEKTIVEFPSPILRAANRDVTEFDDELAELAAEFMRIMYDANGVGVAAPQLGLNLRLFVYNPDPSAPGVLKKMGERVVCNPKIVEYCGGIDVDIEGCLSSRSECCIGDICRSKELRVEYQDVKGRVQQKLLKGFEARVFQHEFDHLEGILHIDRQCPADRARIQPFLDVLIEQHGPGGAIEPDPQKVATLQPPPIKTPVTPQPAPRPPKIKRPATTRAARDGGSAGASGGFGAGGFGGAGGRKSSGSSKTGKAKGGKKKRK